MVNIIYAPKKLNEPKAGQRQIDLETSYSQCWTKKYFENSKRKTADHKLVAGNTIKINNWLLTAIAEWHRVVKLFKWKTLKDVIFRKAVFQEWRWSEAFLEEQELGERIAAGYALDRVLVGKWTWRNCLTFFSSLFFFWLSKLGVSLCKMVEGEALEVFPSTTAKHRLGGPTAIHYFGTGESAGIFTRGDGNKAWGSESWRGLEKQQHVGTAKPHPTPKRLATPAVKAEAIFLEHMARTCKSSWDLVLQTVRVVPFGWSRSTLRAQHSRCLHWIPLSSSGFCQ